MIHDNTMYSISKIYKKNYVFFGSQVYVICTTDMLYHITVYVYVKLQNEIQVKMTSTHKILCLLTLIIIHDPAMHNKDWETRELILTKVEIILS